MPKTALTIPCYNEASRLDPGQYRMFLEKTPEVDLIFVDDGSADATFDVIEAIARENPGRVIPLRQHPNQGKAAAVRRGTLEAFDKGYSFAGYWDADNATPLRLVQPIIWDLERKGVQMVMGSRVNLLGKMIQRSQSRHYLGRFFASVASFILKLQIYDTQCGAKVFCNSPMTRQAFAEPFETGWTFDLELIARVILAGRQEAPDAAASALIIEHPLDEWVDVPGSKLRMSHALGIMRDLYLVYRRYHGRL